MRKRVNYICKCHFILAMIVSFLFSNSLNAQETQFKTESIADLRKAVSWLDKQLFSELESISEWEIVKIQYNDSVAVRDSLQKVSEVRDSIKMSIGNQIKERQDILTAYFSKNFQSDYTNFQCDTTILLLHQGMYGDGTIEKKQEALLGYLRVKEILKTCYDSIAIDNARNMLKQQMSEVFPKEYSIIDYNIAQYGLLTENLRKALITANDIRPEPDASRSQHMIEKYKKEFFVEVSKTLDPVLLSPKIYPYLYGILNKAMEAKMEDPSNDIIELIGKL